MRAGELEPVEDLLVGAPAAASFTVNIKGVEEATATIRRHLKRYYKR